MKKTLTTLALVFLALSMWAQGKPQDYKTYQREGNTFVQNKAESQLMQGDQVTTYKWRDAKGNEYPIILHTYTKGEKAGRTTAYVIRTSKKTGKEYRYFLPDGEQIAEEIINESN